MRLAIVGGGLAGSYLYARLQGEHELTIIEKTPAEKYTAVCAWGTCLYPMRELASRAGLNFDDYVLHKGREMQVRYGSKDLYVRLEGLVTFDKTRFVLDLRRGAREVNAIAERALFPYHKYDLVVDATGFVRELLPKMGDDLWVPTVEYLVKYSQPPLDDFYVEPFPGLTGYAWYFPLGDGLAHVGAGDMKGRHFGWVNEFLRRYGGEPLRRVGRPVRITPATRVDPLAQGRSLAVGEAAGAIFPAVGEGIIPSLQSVEDLLLSGFDPDRYGGLLRRRFRIYDLAYSVIKSKVLQDASWLGLAPAGLRLYLHLYRNRRRYGLEVPLLPILQLLRL
ncbi:MAG: dehydrogenase [Nitrososphaerota archaeon]